MGSAFPPDIYDWALQSMDPVIYFNLFRPASVDTDVDGVYGLGREWMSITWPLPYRASVTYEGPSDWFLAAPWDRM